MRLKPSDRRDDLRRFVRDWLTPAEDAGTLLSQGTILVVGALALLAALM